MNFKYVLLKLKIILYLVYIILVFITFYIFYKSTTKLYIFYILNAHLLYF